MRVVGKLARVAVRDGSMVKQDASSSNAPNVEGFQRLRYWLRITQIVRVFATLVM